MLFFLMDPSKHFLFFNSCLLAILYTVHSTCSTPPTHYTTTAPPTIPQQLHPLYHCSPTHYTTVAPPTIPQQLHPLYHNSPTHYTTTAPPTIPQQLHPLCHSSSTQHQIFLTITALIHTLHATVYITNPTNLEDEC